jgi:hypothetical protein
VNLARKKGVQVNRLLREGISDQQESGIGSAGVEHSVKDGRDHQRDQPFGEANHGKRHNARHKPHPVRLDVLQQLAEFSALLQRKSRSPGNPATTASFGTLRIAR